MFIKSGELAFTPKAFTDNPPVIFYAIIKQKPVSRAVCAGVMLRQLSQDLLCSRKTDLVISRRIPEFKIRIGNAVIIELKS